jgi:hypothetical protein
MTDIDDGKGEQLVIYGGNYLDEKERKKVQTMKVLTMKVNDRPTTDM